MKNRTEEIHKRHQQRKRQRMNRTFREEERTIYMPETGEREDHFPLYRDSGGESGNRSHPLFKKERVLVRIMAAVCLFLVIGVLFKHPSQNLNEARSFVNDVFHKEFQFAMVSNWYEEQFGQPLALLPSGDENTAAKDETTQLNYALPANGTVLQSFEDNGKGIMVETVDKTEVEAVKQGMVIDINNTDSLGKTVIIQHPDGNESVYGKLKTVNVDLYDYVKRKAKIGTVSPSEDGESGTFYFALKQGGTFINPIKVINFD